MWIKAYEKINELGGDDLASFIDYKVGYINTYNIQGFGVEKMPSGAFKLCIETNDGDYILAIDTDEQSVLDQAQELADKLNE